jgi:hypothetical protein
LSVEVLEDRLTPSTFQVTSAADPTGPLVPGTLRYEINQANMPGNGGSTVEITSSVSSAAINLTAGALSITSNMTIANDSGHPIDLHQATAGSRVITISGPQAIQATITGTSSASELTIDGGSVTNANGGGILVTNPLNTLALVYVTLINNSASGPAVSSSTQLGTGGGICSSGVVFIDHSTVGTTQSPNHATGLGGGIWAGKGVTVSAGSVSGNTATAFGGGIAVNSGNVTIDFTSSVNNNSTSGTGGGIAVASGNITVSNGSHVDKNSASSVGGILAGSGTVYVVNLSTVSSNTATSTGSGGGGIFDVKGSVYLSDAQVNNNTSHGMFSGGITILLGGVSVLDSSEVNSNTGNGPGGGIADNFLGSVTIAGSSQVNGNTGAGLGGGIVNFSGGFGGFNISGNSQVNSNKVTNAETVPQVVATFLTLIKSPAIGSFAVVVGGSGGGQMKAALKQAVQYGRQTQNLMQQALRQARGAPAGLVAGGGIATLLGCPVVITTSSQVQGNTAGVSVNGRAAPGIGGGIFAFRGRISISAGVISGNSATAGGGGIWSAGTLNVSDSLIALNTAANASTPVQGGGLLNGPGGRATILNSLIFGNHGGLGGGMANQASLTVIDTTIENNVATSTGGGIFNHRKLVQVGNTYSGNTPNDVATG